MKTAHSILRPVFGSATAVVTILVVLFFLGRGVSLASDPMPGLVGHWQFEEGAGTAVSDSSGNGLNGTLSGPGGWVTSPLGNFAVDFIPNTRVALGNPNALKITGAMTLTAWVNVDSIANAGRIVARAGASGSRGWSINVENNNTWAFIVASNGTTSVSLNPGPVITNEWVHVAGVYDPTNLTMRFYTNGILAGEKLTGVPAAQFSGASINAFIGSRSDGIYWDGRIDEVRVFTNALTAAEINALPELVPTPLTLVTQPVSRTVAQFRPVTFTSKVSGSPPHHYQWLSNSLPIPGANDANYTIPSTLLDMSGSVFAVTVSNLFYSVTSSNAILTVTQDTNPPVLISVGSADGVTIGLCFSEPVEFMTATDPFSYAVNEIIAASPVLRADGRSVVLTPTAPIAGPFTVKVNYVQDLSGNVIALDSTASGTVAALVPADLNSPAQPGSTFSCKDGELDLTTGGTDIGGAADQGHTALKSLSGDFDLQVRVIGLTPISDSPRAGLMVRESTAADSPTLHVLVNPSGIEARRRLTLSGGTASWGTNFTGNTLPGVRVRLRRTSDLFTAFHSTNGTDWVIMGQVAQVFPDPLLVGLAATAHNNNAPAVLAEFRGFGDTVFQNATLNITQSPASVTAAQNSTVVFSALAEGTGAPAAELVYQWQRDDAMGGAFTNIVGANSPTLSVFARPQDSGARFRVRVHLAGLVVDSTAALLTLTPDVTPPTIQSVAAPGQGNQVIVLFSEAVETATATEITNYAITRVVGGAPVAISSASLGADGRSVTLDTELLAEETLYRITVNRVQDLGVPANAIAADSEAQFQYNSLVACWQFEEGSGITTADSSGNGLTGTLVNGPAWVASLFGNYALNFNSARVDFGNPPPLHLTGPMTVAAWVNVDSLADNGRIVTKGGGPGQRGWSLNLEGIDVWAFQIAVSASINVSLNAPAIPLGRWTHVAGVYDPSVPSMRLYTNGVLGAERTDMVPASQFNSAQNVSVGARADSSTFFDGRIDEVRVHARALSASQIAVLGRPKFLSTTRTGDVVHLDWGGAGRLESAPSVSGPWTEVIPPAIPPYDYTVPPGENRFFRLSFTP